MHHTVTPSLDLFSLKGDTALITGATRGIGAACAIALAQAGASLVIVIRPPPAEGAEQDPPIVSQILSASPKTNRDQLTVVQCDLGDMEDVKSLFPRALALLASRIQKGGDDNDNELDMKEQKEKEPKDKKDKKHPQINILINCAGIQRRNKAVDFEEADWDDVLNVNLKSVFLLSQAAGRHMVPLRRGRIINFASLLTFQGGITVPAYAAAKGGIGQLTKALANEWSKEGVCVNAIAPGYIETDMNEKLLKDEVRLRQISERIPAGRWGRPEDFAGPVVFLASRASQYVCGEVLVVDGGWMGR